MRVLLLNQAFWPDRAGSARLLTDVARHLGQAGHDVTVIAGPATRAVETQAAPPVRIVRAPSLVNGSSLPARAISFLAYLVVRLQHAGIGH